MDFSEHVLISAGGSVALYSSGAGAPAAAAFFACGVFMDLDHLADYWRETGLNFRVREFMDYFWMRRPRRLLLFLHSFELGPLLALCFAWKGAPAWAWAALAGWAVHLFLDDKVNRLHRWAYFFGFRLWHRFDARIIDTFKN